jgi:Zn-dependent M28 family amino/carboxypeptidase
MRILPDTKGAKRLLLIILGLLAVTAGCAGYFTFMPGKSFKGNIPSPNREEMVLAEDLRSHVEYLAGTIGQRNLDVSGSLELSANYISKTLRDAGYEVRLLPYEMNNLEVRNIEVELKGNAKHDEIVVMGAHYDTAYGTKGANDNASGVAAIIELAKAMKDKKTDRTVKFVLFVNEEPPYFQTEVMGSHVYAMELREQEADVTAMLSLESSGYYSDQPGSQLYPFPGSRPIVRKSIGAFRQSVDFHSEGAALPGFMPGVDWSDHWGFWRNGYPGIMVTDTALYRYKHYHTYEDTPEKLDYTRMARVVKGLRGVIEELASH